MMVEGKSFNDYLTEWNQEYMHAVIGGEEATIERLLDELVKEYGRIDEATKQLRERIKKQQKDTTFADMEDSFIGTLMNLDATAGDWGQEIGRTLARKIIEEFIVTNGIMGGLQATFDEAMSADGATKDTVLAAMLPQIEEAKKQFGDLKDIIDPILEALGIIKEDNTELPLSDLRSTFVDTLLDMEGDAGTFGKRIGSQLMQQMLEQMLASEYYAKEIEAIRSNWQKALDGEEGYTVDSVTKDIEALNAEIGKDENIQKVISAYKELNKELEKTDSTFKDMDDSWTSALVDMNATTDDFGRQIGQTLVEKLLRELVVSKELQTYLDDIQKAYDEAISSKNATIESVLKAVEPAISKAVEKTKEWKPVVDAVVSKFQELDVSTPLDNLRDSFRSALMDISNDTKDFADDISKILTEAFIDKFVLGDKFDEMVKEWQKRYSDIMDDEGISPEERTRQLEKSRVFDPRGQSGVDP